MLKLTEISIPPKTRCGATGEEKESDNNNRQQPFSIGVHPGDLISHAYDHERVDE